MVFMQIKFYWKGDPEQEVYNSMLLAVMNGTVYEYEVYCHDGSEFLKERPDIIWRVVDE